MTLSLAALAAVFAAAAADPTPVVTDPEAAAPPAAEDAEGVTVTVRPPVVGDLQAGVVNYRPEFFTPVRPGTAMDMVTWLPGFVFEDTRDIRGIGGSTGNVLIDGKPPTSKTDTLQSVLRRIPASQVERVDIIVGGSPGIDMRGRNVIANVILKAGATTRRVVTATTLFDNHGRPTPTASLSTSQKRDGKVIEAALDVGRLTASGPGWGYGSMVRRDGAGTLLYAARTQLVLGGPSASGSGTYEFPLASGRLRVNGLARYYGTGYEGIDTLTTGPGRYSIGQESSYRQGELGVRYERSFGRATVETQALERLTVMSSDDRAARPGLNSTFHLEQENIESVLRTTVRFKKDDRLTLEAFAEAALNRSDNASAGAFDGVPRALPNDKVAVSERRGETGAALSWKPTAKFSLDTGLKVEASNLTAAGDTGLSRTYVYWKPKASLSWAPDKNTQVRLRVEHEVGQVGFGAFTTFAEYNTNLVRLGNANLKPQRAFAAEASLQRGFWNGADLTLTARHRALRDVIETLPVVTLDGVFGFVGNAGNGSQTDLSANLTLPLKRFGLEGAMLKAGVNWFRPRITDPLDGRGRPTNGTAELAGELHFAQDFPKWKFNWGFDAYYRGKTTTYRLLGNEDFSAWPRVNIFAEYRFQPTFVLRVEVSDLPGVNLRHQTQVFDGLRNASPLLYTEDRRLTSGPQVFFRLRRTFE